MINTPIPTLFEELKMTSFCNFIIEEQRTLPWWPKTQLELAELLVQRFGPDYGQSIKINKDLSVDITRNELSCTSKFWHVEDDVNYFPFQVNKAKKLYLFEVGSLIGSPRQANVLHILSPVKTLDGLQGTYKSVIIQSNCTMLKSFGNMKVSTEVFQIGSPTLSNLDGIDEVLEGKALELYISSTTKEGWASIAGIKGLANLYFYPTQKSPDAETMEVFNLVKKNLNNLNKSEMTELLFNAGFKDYV